MLGRIGCPMLAVQGVDGEYGMLQQIRKIARRAPQTVLLELLDWGIHPIEIKRPA